jgi:hypothetical protein
MGVDHVACEQCATRGHGGVDAVAVDKSVAANAEGSELRTVPGAR